MKDLEKTLKKQAESILPSAEVKARILSCLPSEEKEEKTVKPRARRAPRRYVYSMVAAVLVVCIGLGLGLGFGLSGKDGTPALVPSDTYVALSINPSFGITATADGVVTEVTALNEDAVLVLYGVDFTGKQIDETATALVELSAKLGYLEDGGKADFTVCNSDGKTAESVWNAISAKIDESETLFALNITLNPDLGGIASLERKAKEVLAGVDISGLSAEEINKLLNGFDGEKLKAYAESIDDEISSLLDMVVETAHGLAEAIEDYSSTKNYLSLLTAVANANDCVKIYLNYIGVEDTDDLIGALVTELMNYNNVQKALDFMYDLCDGDGNFDFDIELLLKAEIKAEKTN